MVDVVGIDTEIGSARAPAADRDDGRPRTVVAALLDALAERGDRPALYWREIDGRWRSWSVAELAEQVARASAGLRELGVEPGDRVLLMLPNCPEFHVADLAVLCCGATPVSVYNSSAPEQLAYLAEHAAATAAIVDNAEFLARLTSIRAQVPRLRRIVLVHSPPQPGAPDVLAWQHLVSADPIDLASAADGISPSMPATILYTSGTTGQPKGVVLSHANVAAVLADIRSQLGDPVGLRTISYLPMTHIIERDLSHYGAVFNGVEVYCCPDPAQLDQYLREVRPQLLFGSPKVWDGLRTRALAALSASPQRASELTDALQAAGPIALARLWNTATEDQIALWERLDDSTLHAARESVGLDQIRFALSGAAPISPELVHWFNALGVPLSEIYGLTETTGGAAWAARRIKPGTVGPALPSCELRIDEDGEVLCRGPLVFAGYLDEAEKTGEVIDAAGWLHTGDIGHLDDEGYLSIVDRKKELIITAEGDNVSPANLEAAINSLPLVGHSCVVGDARAYVAALVTLDHAAATAWAHQHGITSVTPAELAGHRDVIAEIEGGVQQVMGQFNRAEAVKKIQVLDARWLPDSDELTATGKPKRRNIHGKYAAEIEGLYTSVSGRVNPLGYNSLWHLRADGWTSLEERGMQLAATQGELAEQLSRSVADTLALLAPVETYFAFPGAQTFGQLRRLTEAGRYDQFALMVARINRAMITESYRAGGPWSSAHAPLDPSDTDAEASDVHDTTRPYFEVLVVEELTSAQERALREELRRLRRPDEQFVYEIVVVPSIEDAVIAALVNFDLQACVIRTHFTLRSRQDLTALGPFMFDYADEDIRAHSADERAQRLAGLFKAIRPELDLYLMSNMAVEESATRLSRDFRRIFHHREGCLELHLSLLSGVAHRYRTPFFTALKEYSHRPTGVFHALPISQGKSVVGSHWARDMVGFYGLEVFLAETSATCGGLDSLLEPTGALREAQRAAGEAFGSHRTFFVTNGTSTGNKIVVQALVRPGDIVLVDRNCHQSHHYGLVAAGAHVAYLDAYRLNQYTMYGAVPLREIKRQLLAFKRAGKLDRVKMLALTNCTFDGIVYNVERVMEECLAIKPDLVFLWDEAWFAFARFHPVYRTRTAMASAQAVLDRLRSPAYRRRYAEYAEQMYQRRPDDEALLDTRLLPDPARARVRVYASQSTHKTLTALRQGSMIHIFDQDFNQKVEDTFHEAYMAQTSTSPNYQILASLDVGRRQVALEGFEMVQKQIENAMRLRDAIDNHPLLRNYLRCLTTTDLIPDDYRHSGIDRPLRSGLATMRQVWRQDEFVLDPSRITLYIGATGVDGDTFKHTYLMDRYGVQVNKTARNSVLFMTNIGTTRSSVAYLIEVLVTIVRELEDQFCTMSPRERAAHERAVLKLTNPIAPLADFSAFHDSFRPGTDTDTPEGDMRRAFFLAYDDTLCEYLMPEEIEERIAESRPVVSATFVTPYPPGFPVLVPGQIVSQQIMSFMRSLDTREIHGLRPEVGYRVFTEKALETAGSWHCP